MKIPHSFSVAPIAAPRVRKVNDKTMQANAIQEQAKQGLVAGVNQAVQTGNAIYQDHIQKQYGSDMIAGSAMLDQLKIKRDDDIKGIPVDSAVDYAAEVQKINESYNTQWKGWSKKNIRNQGHPTVRELRQDSIDAFEHDGATTSARLGVQYEDARNVSNIEISTAMLASAVEADPFNQDAADKLKANQDALVKLGAQTAGEAATKKEALQTGVYKMRDEQSILAAENAIREGDLVTAKAAFDSLSPLVSKEKRKSLEATAYKDQTYQKYIGNSRDLESFAAWDQWNESVTSDPHLDKGSRQYQYLLNKYDAGIDAVNANLLDEANVEANVGNFSSALESVDQMRGLKSGEKKLIVQGIKSTGAKYDFVTAASDTDGAVALRGLLEESNANKGKVMTIGDQATASSKISTKLKATLKGQYSNRAAAMKGAVDDGEWNSAAYSKLAKDDTANGFGIEDVDTFMEMGAAAANFRATEINAERIIDEVKQTDDYKDLDDTIAEGMLDPTTFNFDAFSEEVIGSEMNPVVQADLMSRAYEINAAKSSTYKVDGGGFFSTGRDISQEERDFRGSLSSAYSQLIKASPGMVRGLGATYTDLDAAITMEGKKESPEWETLFKKIQSQGVIQAITQ